MDGYSRYPEIGTSVVRTSGRPHIGYVFYPLCQRQRSAEPVLRFRCVLERHIQPVTIKLDRDSGKWLNGFILWLHETQKSSLMKSQKSAEKTNYYFPVLFPRSSVFLFNILLEKFKFSYILAHQNS